MGKNFWSGLNETQKRWIVKEKHYQTKAENGIDIQQKSSEKVSQAENQRYSFHIFQ